MIIRRLVVLSTFIAVWASSVMAQELLPSTVLMRDMSNSFYRDLNSMVKGETPFDAKKAESAFRNLSAGAGKISATVNQSLKGKSSPDSRYAASPKVWENRADFDAQAAKLVQVLQESQPKAGTPEGLKAVYSSVNNACNSCHENYRVRTK